jgi:hypothetical protein
MQSLKCLQLVVDVSSVTRDKVDQRYKKKCVGWFLKTAFVIPPTHGCTAGVGVCINCVGLVRAAGAPQEKEQLNVDEGSGF